MGTVWLESPILEFVGSRGTGTSSGGQGGLGGLTPFSGAGKVITAVDLKNFLALSRSERQADLLFTARFSSSVEGVPLCFRLFLMVFESLFGAAPRPLAVPHAVLHRAAGEAV